MVLTLALWLYPDSKFCLDHINPASLAQPFLSVYSWGKLSLPIATITNHIHAVHKHVGNKYLTWTWRLWIWRTCLLAFSVIFCADVGPEFLWIIDDHPTTKDKHTGGFFSWLITLTFYQISDYAWDYFHWHRRTRFVWFSRHIWMKMRLVHIFLFSST